MTKLKRLISVMSIFLSGMLIFTIEPMSVKALLPLFGGSAAVWLCAMTLFQGLVLAAAVYVNLVSSLFETRGKVICAVHAVLLWVLYFYTNPVPGLVAGSINSVGQFFPFAVIKILFTAFGPIFFMLVCQTTIFQIMESKLSTKGPWYLYAVSNIAALLGLLAFPFFIEPSFDLVLASKLWKSLLIIHNIFFTIYTVINIFSSSKISSTKSSKISSKISSKTDSKTDSKTALKENKYNFSEEKKPKNQKKGDKIFWFLSSLCSCMLLYGVTDLLCGDVGVIPFLYVFPLALFLLSYAMAFSSIKVYSHRLNFTLAAILLPFFAMATVLGLKGSYALRFFFFNTSFFIFCLVIHEQLYRKRPEQRGLTSFYLQIGLGGFLGGCFCSIISPMIFNTNVEISLGLLLFAGLVISEFYKMVTFFQKSSIKSKKRRRFWWLVSASIPVIAVVCIVLLTDNQDLKVKFMRNHYSVKRVVESPLLSSNKDKSMVKLLFCNNIIHGIEFLNEPKKLTSYYGLGTGIDKAFSILHKRKGSLKTAVFGLGAGVIALYSKKGDIFDYFEIDPQMIEIAKNDFTFLKNSRAENRIFCKDARIGFKELITNQKNGQKNIKPYDLIVIDVFTGGAVPVHLLTEQAFEIYFSGLASDGVILINISNAYIDFNPLIMGLAKRFSKKAGVIRYATKKGDATKKSDASKRGDTTLSNDAQLGSDWAAIFSESGDYKEFTNSPHILKNSEEKILWTDSSSNLYKLLK